MPIKVVDFFSCCGGTSAGLRTAGMDIVLGLDNDDSAAKSFKTNFPEADFFTENIRQVEVEDLEPFLNEYLDQMLLFSGCAPCQPFSR